jgi:hypothetical protein
MPPEPEQLLGESVSVCERACGRYGIGLSEFSNDSYYLRIEDRCCCGRVALLGEHLLCKRVRELERLQRSP